MFLPRTHLPGVRPEQPKGLRRRLLEHQRFKGIHQRPRIHEQRFYFWLHLRLHGQNRYHRHHRNRILVPARRRRRSSNNRKPPTTLNHQPTSQYTHNQPCSRGTNRRRTNLGLWTWRPRRSRRSRRRAKREAEAPTWGTTCMTHLFSSHVIAGKRGGGRVCEDESRWVLTASVS